MAGKDADLFAVRQQKRILIIKRTGQVSNFFFFYYFPGRGEKLFPLLFCTRPKIERILFNDFHFSLLPTFFYPFLLTLCVPTLNEENQF